jgi:hypothetical protein
MRRRLQRRNRGCETGTSGFNVRWGTQRAAADWVLELGTFWGEVDVAAHSIADVPRLRGPELIEFRKPDEEGS